jgi:outer membrane murein-binding lipoprotein Lpp
MRKFLAAIAGCCALSACISEQDMSAVESTIAEFHARQAAGDDMAIYRAGSMAFKTSTTVAQLSSLNDAIRAAEGCGPPERDRANVSTRVSTSGSFVTVLYVRTCARGTIAEQFLMRLGGDGPEVEGYHISGEPILASPRV